MWNNIINVAIAAIAINISILDFIKTECTVGPQSYGLQRSGDTG